MSGCLGGRWSVCARQGKISEGEDAWECVGLLTTFHRCSNYCQNNNVSPIILTLLRHRNIPFTLFFSCTFTSYCYVVEARSTACAGAFRNKKGRGCRREERGREIAGEGVVRKTGLATEDE